MIIFLYGQDTYRSCQKLKEIIGYYKKIHKSNLNLRCFDDENLSFQGLKNELENRSIFRGKKLVVLKGVFLNKKFQEEFLEEGKKTISSGNVVLIYEKKEVNRKSLFFKSRT